MAVTSVELVAELDKFIYDSPLCNKSLNVSHPLEKAIAALFKIKNSIEAQGDTYLENKKFTKDFLEANKWCRQVTWTGGYDSTEHQPLRDIIAILRERTPPQTSDSSPIVYELGDISGIFNRSYGTYVSLSTRDIPPSPEQKCGFFWGLFQSRAQSNKNSTQNRRPNPNDGFRLDAYEDNYRLDDDPDEDRYGCNFLRNFLGG